MNHKWENNICMKCGILREKREYKRAGLPYSRLGRDGCWYDKIPYTYGIGWYYMKPNPTGFETKDNIGFERPECI